MRILLAGESWVTHSTHLKGFDAFHTTEYVEGAGVFIEAVRAAGHTLDYLPCHLVPTAFPATLDELAPYDVVVLSDIGSNTFLLPPETVRGSVAAPNRLDALAAHVAGGAGLLMVGGYLSFAGIDGRARFGQSPLAGVLPVVMSAHDDRHELPQGIAPQVADPAHPVLRDVPEGAWPALLGLNRVAPAEGAEVLVTCGDDPLLVVGDHARGRAAAFTSDLAPHWAPPAFLAWNGYAPLWEGLLRWLAAGRAKPSAIASSSPGDATV
jgi:uncharacterized membrane protein